MYRIISGKWKAKRIAAPKNFDVRPTTDFAKEALFSLLENRYELGFCAVLDLFAGIGSVSLEFASRECPDITCVEMNPRHTAFIHTTAAQLDMGNQLNVHRADVFEFLKKNRNNKQYDIIFADPPFEMEDKKYEELVSLVLNNKFLKPGGLFVLEHQSRKKFGGCTDTRKYGNVSFSLFPAPATEREAPE